MNFQEFTLSDLLARFGGRLQAIQASPVATEEVKLSGFASLVSSKNHHISFLSNLKLKFDVLETQARIVLVAEKDVEELVQLTQSHPCSVHYFWVVKNPYLTYAHIQTWWVSQSQVKSPLKGIHSSAVIDATATVHPTACIGAGVVIGAYSRISSEVHIGPGTVISDQVYVGSHTMIYPNVSVYSETIIGNFCIIHSGVVLGADGFGFAHDGATWVKIPQVGKVVIADHVEIGANTTIDRGALDDTLIGFGVKLDNQIMIAHNCTIGEHTAVAGCVGMAGSTHIGARCTIGGAAMLLGHLNIPEGTHITGATAIMSTIQRPGAYTGIFPATEHSTWEKNAVLVKQLSKLRQRVLEIEKKLLK